MNMHLAVAQMQAQAVMTRWHRIIPPCAKNITFADTHVRYLHPTKGYRYVSKRRLGLEG